jgi:hypothetical protein
MKINGKLALKGSGNDPIILEHDDATVVGDESTHKRGVVKFANGMKMQWDTVSIAANSSVVVNLWEHYTDAQWCAYACMGETVTDDSNQQDVMAWVPSSDNLRTVTVRNIGGSTADVTYMSIGRDHVPAVAVIDDKAISFDGNEWTKNKAAGDLLGIANEWSIQVNYNPYFNSLNSYLVSIQHATNQNQIAILDDGAAATEHYEVVTRNSAGGQIKTYEWNHTIVTGTNISVIATWDGTNLKFYIDGVDQGEADAKTVDNSGTMSDSLRTVAFANLGTSDFADLGANMHSVSIWNVALTQAEITSLQNGGAPENLDNRFATGNYAKQDNLMHYWRLGLDPNRMGRDYGKAAPIDIMEDPTGVDSGDIVDY